MKKKGFQLSISVIVTIIIAVVLLGLGVLFLNKFIGGSMEIKEQLDERTEQQLALLLESGEKVAVPFNSATLRRGDSKVIGLGVLNIDSDSEHDYEVLVEFSGADNDVEDINLTEWVLYDESVKKLKPTEQFKLGILFRVPQDAASGTYIFNLIVNQDSGEYDVKKVYITVA